MSSRVATLAQVTPNREMAFTSLNGTVDVTLPAATKANLRLRSSNGEIYSDFDVQLSQGIPFIGELTRADWELLLAYRNLFYEVSEGGTLDELSVVNPPTRMLGGITVRF